MTVRCVRCTRVIFRYQPVEDEAPGLCDVCVVVQAKSERAQLSCGRVECVLGEVPYDCVVDGAASGGRRSCPASASEALLTAIP